MKFTTTIQQFGNNTGIETHLQYEYQGEHFFVFNRIQYKNNTVISRITANVSFEIDTDDLNKLDLIKSNFPI